MRSNSTKKNQRARLAIVLVALLAPPLSLASDSGWSPTQSVETSRAQHRRLPVDDIWWSRTGEDMAWNFKNLHQLFPTAIVPRLGRISELALQPSPDIASYRVSTPRGEMPFEAFIESDLSTTLGVIIVHQGKIVFERYPRMQDFEMPVYWSVAKAFVGIIARILEERGELDVSRTIDDYIPALIKSSLAGIQVRALLDMASGLDCGDDYEDRTSCYYRYSMAIGDGFRTEDAPDNPYDFAASLEVERVGPPGITYAYSGFDTFVIGWLVEEITGLRFQDVLAREIWQHIGAESHAAYIAPRYGIAVTHGGFIARLRDLARLGMLFTPSWQRVSETRIISQQHIDFLKTAGTPALQYSAALPGAEAPVLVDTLYQWDGVYPNGFMVKGGWAGQGLMVNPDWDLVAVFASYNRDDDASETALEPVVWQLLHDLFAP